MKIRKMFLSLMMLILSACDNRAKEVKMINRLENETFKEIRDKYGLFPQGFAKYGSKTDLSVYDKIGLMFGSDRIIAKDEGRKILFEITDVLMKKINSHEEVKPYLTNWPITERDVKISLVVRAVSDEDWDAKDVMFFYLNEYGLQYSYRIPGEKYEMRDETETIEEGRMLLNKKDV